MNRRQLLKFAGKYSTLLMAGVSTLSIRSVALSEDKKAPPPNIIVIMGDDHARWASGVYGFGEGLTPNLDWMARNGVRFNNAISPAPVCSPARASFYTGKTPSQHGVHDFLAEGSGASTEWLAGETLLSERLKQQGYRTALFGKWHATRDSRQPQPGFDRWLSYDVYREGWQNQYKHSGEVYFSDDSTERSYKGVQARFLTDEAVKFIDQREEEPFFISLNFVEPHAPFDDMPERLVQKYRGMAYDLISDGGSSDLADRGERTSTPKDHDEKLAQYLAAAALIDEQIGRMIDALEGRGLIDNTIIVYTSDHGLLMGNYGLYGKVNATQPANFYEDTISIPMVFYSGGDLIRRGQQRTEFVDLIDLHATVLGLAGHKEDLASEYGPGRSLNRLLAGGRYPGWRQFHFAERANARMVSDGRWKLVRYYKKDLAAEPIDKWYDLAHPQGESRESIAGPSGAIQDIMTAALEGHFAKYEVPEHSGRSMWSQPMPNPRLARDLRKFE